MLKVEMETHAKIMRGLLHENENWRGLRRQIFELKDNELFENLAKYGCSKKGNLETLRDRLLRVVLRKDKTNVYFIPWYPRDTCTGSTASLNEDSSDAGHEEKKNVQPRRLRERTPGKRTVKARMKSAARCRSQRDSSLDSESATNEKVVIQGLTNMTVDAAKLGVGPEIRHHLSQPKHNFEYRLKRVFCGTGIENFEIRERVINAVPKVSQTQFMPKQNFNSNLGDFGKENVSSTGRKSENFENFDSKDDYLTDIDQDLFEPRVRKSSNNNKFNKNFDGLDSVRVQPRNDTMQAVKFLKTWGIQFSGEDKNDDPEEFIEQLIDCKNSCCLSDKGFIDALPSVLSRGASRWFRTVRDQIKNWADFVEKFRKYFVGEYDEEDLLDELRVRSQGKGEKITNYLCCIRFLVSKFSRAPSEKYLVTRVFRNLLPSYRKAMMDKLILTLADVERYGRAWEEQLALDVRYVPPPPLEKMRVRGAAFNLTSQIAALRDDWDLSAKIQTGKSKGGEAKERINGVTNGNLVVNEVCAISQVLNECSQKYQSDGIESARQKIFNGVCYYCKSIGHRVSECQAVVCSYCKMKGHFLRNCPLSPPEVICYFCQTRGHISRNCPKKKRNINQPKEYCIMCGKIGVYAKSCPDCAAVFNEFLEKESEWDPKLKQHSDCLFENKNRYSSSELGRGKFLKNDEMGNRKSSADKGRGVSAEFKVTSDVASAELIQTDELVSGEPRQLNVVPCSCQTMEMVRLEGKQYIDCSTQTVKLEKVDAIVGEVMVENFSKINEIIEKVEVENCNKNNEIIEDEIKVKDFKIIENVEKVEIYRIIRKVRANMFLILYVIISLILYVQGKIKKIKIDFIGNGEGQQPMELSSQEKQQPGKPNRRQPERRVQNPISLRGEIQSKYGHQSNRMRGHTGVSQVSSGRGSRVSQVSSSLRFSQSWVLCQVSQVILRVKKLKNMN